MGAGNSAVVVDLPRWRPMLSPRVPNLVPIPGPRKERETPGQRPRPNYGHPHAAERSPDGEARGSRRHACHLKPTATRYERSTAPAGAKGPKTQPVTVLTASAMTCGDAFSAPSGCPPSRHVVFSSALRAPHPRTGPPASSVPPAPRILRTPRHKASTSHRHSPSRPHQARQSSPSH